LPRRRDVAARIDAIRIACRDSGAPEEAAVAIEIRQTKRAIVYRAVVATTGSQTISKTFRTKAAAEAWEREMLRAGQRPTNSQ
jgi:hypothetical protein